MYGCTARGQRVYRCSTPAKTGAGTCGHYWIAESNILPRVLQMLGDGIDAVERLETGCPEELRRPETARQEKRADLERQVAAIKAKIDVAAGNLMLADDRTRPLMDAKVKELWAEHDRLIAEQGSGTSDDGPTEEETKRLNDWLKAFRKRAVFVPLDPSKSSHAAFYAKYPKRPYGKYCDARQLNEALHSIGCRVSLRWKTTQVTLSNGKPQNRYIFARGRFQLGQNGSVSFRKVPSAAACSGSFDANRRDSRRGMDSARR